MFLREVKVKMDKKELEYFAGQIENLKQQAAGFLDVLNDLGDEVSAAKKAAMDKMITRTVDIGNGLMLKMYIAGTELINMD